MKEAQQSYSPWHLVHKPSLKAWPGEGGRSRRHALPPALLPVPCPALTWELCLAQGKSISAPSKVGPKSPHLYFLSKIFSPLVQKGSSCVREVSAGHHKQKPAAAENSLLQIIRFTGSPQPLETPHLTQADNTAQEQAPLQHTATNKSRSVAGKCEGMLHSFTHLQPHLGHIATNYCFCLTCRLPLRFPGCETISHRRGKTASKKGFLQVRGAGEKGDAKRFQPKENASGKQSDTRELYRKIG